MESLFGRVSRYPRSPLIDPGENRLTEVTAAVLERVDGLAWRAVVELLATAVEQAERKAATEEDADDWTDEVDRLCRASNAARDLLDDARVRVQTQVPTSKGRFVDMEVWLRPRKPASTIDDVLVWIEVKYGSDLHGDQLDVYVGDIAVRPAAHRVVLLLVPRGQTLRAKPPRAVPVVDWQTISKVVSDRHVASQLPEGQRWLLDEYSGYLAEEGLMDPEALSAAHALALMQASEAEAAIAGICEHADARVRTAWAKPTNYSKPPRSASENPDFGIGYWATFEAQPATKTWQEGWFEWGNSNPDDWQYIDEDEIRGSNVFYAGATFNPKTNPYKVAMNEPWVATLLAAGFVWCWFGYYRLVRVKYPDELLAATTLEEQGQLLASWIVETLRLLEATPPPY